MDKKVIGFATAVAALTPVGAAQALPTSGHSGSLKAQSFAELLAPIPDAVEKLKASDAVLSERDANAAKVELAQYYHHHHHHHRFFRPFFRHHHNYRRFHHHHHHHFYN